MKVAFITFGSPLNMKGLMINVQERAKHLYRAQKKFEIDFYLLRFNDSNLFRFLKKMPKEIYEENTKIGDITYKNIWISRDIVKYLKAYKLNSNTIISPKEFKDSAKLLSKYDLVMSHGYEGNYLSYQNYLLNNVPYIASWHGSDINVYPFKNESNFKLIKAIIEKAYINQFVSQRLLEKSNSITKKGTKEVLYMGVSELFYKYSSSKKDLLLKKYDVEDKIVIGFVGNLIPIKNINALSKIMNHITNNSKYILWIIGDGNLKSELKSELDHYNINYKFFGKMNPIDIPDLMNCMSVLLIPSLNEGLPNVIVEAIKCGVHVLGSNVGGIPEILSPENYFPLETNFEYNIAKRIEYLIDNNIKPYELDNRFEWETALIKMVDNVQSFGKK